MTRYPHTDREGVDPSVPRDRGHWAWPWLVLVLALPGAAWSWYVGVLSASRLFGEQATSADLAAGSAAFLSGASLWLAAALLTAALFHRVGVPVLCALAAIGYTVLGSTMGSGRGPLAEAGAAEWLSAWTPPTSWALAAWGAVALGIWAHRRMTRLDGGAERRPVT